MNKFLKGSLCLGLCGCMLLGVAGCKPDNPNPNPGSTAKKYDTETRALQLSIGALDENFNPFFYTALNDGSMIANTQLGMLTVDESGHLVAGQDQATVALDFKSTMFTDKEAGKGEPTTDGEKAKNGRTEYEFVIKNGIKFSDGVELTAADVLFNLYVYLDPSYTGSNTIYSTDIQGLKAYREQDPTLSDDSDASSDSTYATKARTRIQALKDWATDDVPLNEQGQKDLKALQDALQKELVSDWNSTSSSWVEAFKNTHKFTATWQAYLYNEALIWEQMWVNPNNSLLTQERRYNDDNNNGKRDEELGERFITTLEPGLNGEDPEHQHYIDEVNNASTEDKVNAYIASHAGASKETALTELQKQACVDLAYKYWSDKSNLAMTLSGMRSCYFTILQDFTNEERSKYLQDLKDQGKGVASVKGITVYEAKGSDLTSSFNGDMKETYVADETYSVLKIVINGVDPKAIYNFSFTVAPLHYYSSTNYKGENLVEKAKKHYKDDTANSANDTRYYGMEVGDSDFIKNVLQEEIKNGVPVGAGPYFAADKNGDPAKRRSQFSDNNIIYFVRNPYFETVGTQINNAKIKYLNYKVINDDQIMTSLTSESIDLGMPNASSSNQTIISEKGEFLSSATFMTGGYGYVGVNPKAVPEYQVRQAIMKSLNSSSAAEYFGESFAQPLYRPMTLTSWVYSYCKETDPIYEEYPSIAYSMDNTAGNKQITDLVEAAGYRLEGGKYVKRTQIPGQGNAANGKTLKLTFTIAGDSADHPAFSMFNVAAKRLSSLGFEINVKNDPQALSNLAAGSLEVWAAAWSSSIDPDPYQVYHKDSKATSVNNWNYPEILNNAAEWKYEYDKVQALSDLIDAGRETINENERAKIYVDCLDLIMDLAVEMPTYQRSDLCVYNKKVIDSKSLVKNPSHYMGLFDKIWEIDYV